MRKYRPGITPKTHVEVSMLHVQFWGSASSESRHSRNGKKPGSHKWITEGAAGRVAALAKHPTSSVLSWESKGISPSVRGEGWGQSPRGPQVPEYVELSTHETLKV